jgi:hypothetical protein
VEEEGGRLRGGQSRQPGGPRGGEGGEAPVGASAGHLAQGECVLQNGVNRLSRRAKQDKKGATVVPGKGRMH